MSSESPSPVPPEPPEVLTTAELGRRGVDAAAIRRLLRRGELVRLRRGHYVWASVPQAAREHCRVRAALAARTGSPAVSHGTAAQLWGLPVRLAATHDVHLTAAGSPRTRCRRGVHVHGGRLAESETRVHQGFLVTSVARTVVDLARSEEFRWGLVTADAALHTGLVQPQELQEQLLRHSRSRGLSQARAVVTMADSLVESPGESLCRAALLQHGVPLPQLQHVLRDEQGFVARVDFWWQEFKLVLEFDGREKYLANLRPGSSPTDVLWAEKQREDRLRALGCIVVRCTWDEVLHHPERVARRVLQAMSRARRVITADASTSPLQQRG